MIPEDFSRLLNPALNTSETEGTLQLCTPEVNYTGQAMDTGMTNSKSEKCTHFSSAFGKKFQLDRKTSDSAQIGSLHTHQRREDLHLPRQDHLLGNLPSRTHIWDPGHLARTTSFGHLS